MTPNEWADAIDRYWGAPKAGSRVLMMIEPVLLCEIAQQSGFEFSSKEEAESDFLSAIRSYLSGKASAWSPEPLGPDVPPRFLLQIAVQVYAASKMADDPEGNFTEAAYYIQLEKLVGVYGSRERFNTNDQGREHQKLWRERLLEWAAQKNLIIELPPEKHGAGRHVQLPKSQATLRLADLERLPIFFTTCGFVANDADNPDEMNNQLKRLPVMLKRYSRDGSIFSRWARQILEDDVKFPIALMQIGESLKDWDGCLRLKYVGSRRQLLSNEKKRLWLIVRTRTREVKCFVCSVLAPSKPVRCDLIELLTNYSSAKQPLLSFHEGIALFRYDEELASYGYSDTLEAGDSALLLSAPLFDDKLARLICSDAIIVESTTYGSDGVDVDHEVTGLPTGYKLAKVRITKSLPSYDAIPEEWKDYLRKPRFAITLCGGLRTDRKDEWLSGAGPFLKLCGNQLPNIIVVDGNQINVTDHVMFLDCLSKPGHHEIVAYAEGKRVSKSFAVSDVEANIGHHLPGSCWTFRDSNWPTFEKHLTNQETVLPVLYGIRGERIVSPTPDNVPLFHRDNHEAIRMLVGLPVDHSTVQCSHPLVLHLKRRVPINSQTRQCHE